MRISESDTTKGSTTRGSMRFALLATVLAAGSWGATPGSAETTLSFYGGLADAATGSFDASPLEGATDSETVSPYYGLRATWWRDDNVGYGLDFTRTTLQNSSAGRGGLTRSLGFTNKLNTLTANATYRWPDTLAGATPYVSGGVGVAIPRIEPGRPGGVARTDGYQLGGPAVALIGGISYDLGDRTSIFSEVKVTASKLDVDLQGGGSLDGDVVTNAVNLGVSFRF